AFNSNIIKGVKHLSENQLSSKNIDLLLIGKKAGDVLSKTMNVVESNNEIFDDLTFDNVANMAEKMMDDFIAEKYDQILFVYNKFINAATQEIMTEQFLPILPKKEKQEEIQENEVDYIFEPEKDQIINELIPKTLKIQLFKAIRDSFAAEHGARMTAMHKATDNATDLRDELTLSYNKARQA